MTTTPLSPTERAFLDLQLTLLVQASSKSAGGGRHWRELNASWTDWADRQGLNDPKQRADAKRVNVALNDAASLHAFWALDTQRISATIVGYVAARLVLDDSPAGLLAFLEELLADAREGVQQTPRARVA